MIRKIDIVTTRVQTEHSNQCWLWPYAKYYDGYGQVVINRKTHRVYKVAFELRYGKVPDGLQLDHLCRERSCWNPDHLEVVTQQENIKRGQVGLRHSSKEYCPKGHPYNEENTYHYKNGRYCRECGRENCRRWYAKSRT